MKHSRKHKKAISDAMKLSHKKISKSQKARWAKWREEHKDRRAQFDLFPPII
jgi:ferric-dicitrate binding protein FerR (iron transport regulator)